MSLKVSNGIVQLMEKAWLTPEKWCHLHNKKMTDYKKLKEENKIEFYENNTIGIELVKNRQLSMLVPTELVEFNFSFNTDNVMVVFEEFVQQMSKNQKELNRLQDIESRNKELDLKIETVLQDNENIKQLYTDTAKELQDLTELYTITKSNSIELELELNEEQIKNKLLQNTISELTEDNKKNIHKLEQFNSLISTLKQENESLRNIMQTKQFALLTEINDKLNKVNSFE